jgi:hypothetical protein
MTQKIKVDMAASVRQRLLNMARDEKTDFMLLLRRYAIERLLVRLSESKHSRKFILKGAMLFLAWGEEMPRATKDLDLLGSGTNSIDAIKRIFDSLCLLDTLSIDGLIYNPESITIDSIREDKKYNGLRVKLNVVLSKAHIALQIDIGFGDIVEPSPIEVNFPSLLGNRGPRIRAYPPETAIAEKTDAMITLGIDNSRIKDFYDIWFLSRHKSFKGRILLKAIAATMQRRNGNIKALGLPVVMTPEFFENKNKVVQWNAFIRKTQLIFTPPTFAKLGEDIQSFLLPLIEALQHGKKFNKNWSAQRGWF